MALSPDAVPDPAGDLGELREYLGTAYDHERLVLHRRQVEEEYRRTGDEQVHYRTSQAYLYDLTAFALSATKEPYLELLRSAVAPGAQVLDFGCGIGADGLRLLDQGYEVVFADFDNPSTRFLRWRLERRGRHADVLDVDVDALPTGLDLAFAFDVLEHLDDPAAALARLEDSAALVLVNLLEPEPGDTALHHDLPVGALLRRARDRGLFAYRRLHGRSHVVLYAGVGSRRPSAWRSRATLWAGRSRAALGR